MKKLMVAMAVILTAAFMFGCVSIQNTAVETTSEAAAEDDAAYIMGKGNLVIGITLFDPMNYYDENNVLIGFDTEYAQAVCQKLGLTPQFVEINWDTKEVELAAKSIDCIWNGLTITEERKENMQFSAPYIKNKQCIVIKKDNAGTFVDTASFEGKVLVAEVSSAGEEAILSDENLSKATYIPVAKQADTLLEVKAGTADGAAIDYVMAKSMVGEGTDYADLMIVDGVELAVEEYGIGFRFGSSFAAKVDEATKELVADGTLAAIAEKYGQSDVLIAG